MTLFGLTFDAQQLFALVSLVTMLVFWVLILRRERRYTRWFRQWEADAKARRLDNPASEQSDAGHRRGPWG